MDAKTFCDKILDILKENGKSLEKVKLNKKGTTVFIEGIGAYEIIINKNNKYISVKSRYEHLFRNQLRLSKTKSKPNWVRYEIITEHDLDEISNVILYIFEDCKPSGPMFGCCSRFIECSDAKKCVHPDKQYAKNCWYQENLKQGKIFYGINKNI